MGALFAQFFANPALVIPGAALIASPIIIHLLNRLRFKKVRFAAMEFLLKSQQKNRRRVLFEQLLLLLLRVLIVLIIMAIIARLILDPSQLSAFRGAQSHHILLIDDSGSMRERWGETSAFQEAIGVIKKMITEGSRQPGTQKVTLILLSSPESSLLSPERDVDEVLLQELETRFESLQPTYRRVDLAAGLEAARERFAGDVSAVKYLHILSDYRLDDWRGQAALGESIRTLDEEGVNVNLIKTVPQPGQNLAITQLTGNLESAAKNIPLRLTVGVKNFGDQPAKNIRLSVFLDGVAVPGKAESDKLSEIAPGRDETLELDVVFRTAGRHTVRVSVENDALTNDNIRYLSVNVQDRIPVLIIDGDANRSDASFVADALAPDFDQDGYSPITGIAAQMADPDFLRKADLAQYQCVILANVSELAADAIVRVEDYVRKGGGLAWYVGDLTKSSFFNEKLYLKGKGLFPLPLADASRPLSHDDPNVPDLQFTDHPVFKIFVEGQNNPLAKYAKINRYLPADSKWERDDNKRKDGVATLATLRNGEPLFFEHRYGDGKIITCLSSAGVSWTDWPQNVSYVVYLIELQKYLAKTEAVSELQRTVGQPVTFQLDPAAYSADVSVSAPEASGEGTVHLKLALESLEGGESRYVGAFRGTDVPGIYSVKRVSNRDGEQIQTIAYNVPLEESSLELASTPYLREQIGDAKRLSIRDPGDSQWIENKEAGQEIRRILMFVLVALLIAEQLMAYRLSFHTRPLPQAA